MSIRWTIRYLLCRGALRVGLPTTIPLLGYKGDGKRDCAPMMQAEIDARGRFQSVNGVNKLSRAIELHSRAWNRRYARYQEMVLSDKPLYYYQGNVDSATPPTSNQEIGPPAANISDKRGDVLEGNDRGQGAI